MDTSDHPASAGDYSRLLKPIADELLSPRRRGGRLRAAAAGLYSLCSSVTGIDAGSNRPGDSGGTWLPSGQAVSPEDAAACLLDHGRTSKFLRGAHAAVLEARKRFPGATVEILYAGCGPFAPLAVPLASRFGPDEIRFTLLDAHERSLEAARRVFRAFGLAAYVRDYVRCDAASYRHGARRPLHVVVTETMQAALEKEPQAAITMNLAPQITPGGFFIPEKVTVDACLCDLTKEFPLDTAGAGVAQSPPGARKGGGRIPLGRVLELTAEGCRGPSADGRVGGRGVPARPGVATLDVPADAGGGLHLMLLTAVTVFDSIALGDYQSGLTCPKVLFELGRVRGGARIELAYRAGGEPGFEYRLS